MLDRYSKLVLTVIALGLVGLNIKLWQPQPAQAAATSSPVTMSSFMKSAEMTEAERDALMDNMPVVAVWSILNK